MTDDRLTRMLAAQLNVQQLIQPEHTPLTDMSVEERLDAIRYNYIAAVKELGEALDEVGWKSWATSRHVNGDAMFGELRDTLQFLINLMFLATGDSPTVLADRLERELYAKHAVNVERARRGYDGVSGKCGGCGRDLAEVDIVDVENLNGHILTFCQCGGVVTREQLVAAGVLEPTD